MRKRCIEIRLFLWASVLAFCFLLAGGPSSTSAAAAANPLEEVVAAVEGATAPVQATVETVVPPPPPVPPAAAPPPAPTPPPAVDVPPVRVPEAPVKDTVAAANSTVTEAAVAVSSLGEEATATVETTAGSAGDTVARTVSPVTTPVEEVLGTQPTARTPASAVDHASTAPSPADADVPPTASDRPEVLENVPTRLVDPFVFVWPAVALTVEGPLGGFLRDWSRSVLARFAANRTASLGGDLGPLDFSAPAPASASESDPSDQPAFSWLPSPSRAPFNWVGGESALLVLALAIALATATLAILGLARRELGLPMFRRGNRFPWRH